MHGVRLEIFGNAVHGIPLGYGIERELNTRILFYHRITLHCHMLQPGVGEHGTHTSTVDGGWRGPIEPPELDERPNGGVETPRGERMDRLGPTEEGGQMG